MQIKNKITVIIALLLVLSYSSITPSTSKPSKHRLDGETIRLHIIRYKEGGQIEKKIKYMPFEEYKHLLNNLSETAEEIDLHIVDKLESELEILKKHNIVDKNTTLEDIFSRKNIGRILENISSYDIVSMENFQAHLSPIIVIGGGFGIGLGLFGQRIINAFSSFLAIVGGLALVMCLDPVEKVCYVLFSYMLPLLIGYVTGYIGLILFAVFPGYFYSNLVMIGFTPYTFWFQIPPSS